MIPSNLMSGSSSSLPWQMSGNPSDPCYSSSLRRHQLLHHPFTPVCSQCSHLSRSCNSSSSPASGYRSSYAVRSSQGTSIPSQQSRMKQDINPARDPYISTPVPSRYPDLYGIEHEEQHLASGLMSASEYLPPEMSPFDRTDFMPRRSIQGPQVPEQDLQQLMLGGEEGFEMGGVMEGELDPTNSEKWPNTNYIVKRARAMYTMALSMYQFTRGEGELKTTQDFFAQAEFLSEEANKFYKIVRRFTYQVPSGQMKKDLLEHLNSIPTFVQQLQFSVKNSTVGKAATFTKIDNVIQETKDLMNFISKTVNSCLACASMDVNPARDPYIHPYISSVSSRSIPYPDPYGIEHEEQQLASRLMSASEYLPPEMSPFDRTDFMPRRSIQGPQVPEQDLQQLMLGGGEEDVGLGGMMEGEVDPTNPENWPDTKDNDIVKRAKTMYTMAYSMYQFTRGEGELKTTQDLFTQAEFLTEEANKFYKVVRQFTYQVPSGQMKKELLEHLNNVPTFVQQLQFSVKNSTVGKAATFTKVDNIIQETKDLMNFISKTVNSCLTCASMYNLDMVSRTRSRTLSPSGRGGSYDYDDDRMGSKGGGSSSDASL